MRRPQRVLALLVVAASVLLFAGCTRVASSSLPDLRGVVTSIEPTDSGGSLRVVWASDPVVGAKTDYDAAQVAVTDDTVLRRRSPGSKRQAQPLAFAQLKVGDVVEVWFTGPVAESYPVQATASQLYLIGHYDGELPTPPGLEPPATP